MSHIFYEGNSLYFFNSNQLSHFLAHSLGSFSARHSYDTIKEVSSKLFFFVSVAIVNADFPTLDWQLSIIQVTLLGRGPDDHMNLSELFIEFEYIKLWNLRMT